MLFLWFWSGGKVFKRKPGGAKKKTTNSFSIVLIQQRSNKYAYNNRHSLPSRTKQLFGSQRVSDKKKHKLCKEPWKKHKLCKEPWDRKVYVFTEKREIQRFLQVIFNRVIHRNPNDRNEGFQRATPIINTSTSNGCPF